MSQLLWQGHLRVTGLLSQGLRTAVSQPHKAPRSSALLRSWAEELGPVLQALLLCGSEAAAGFVTQRWLGELQDGGTRLVEELRGAAQQPLGLSEGVGQFLLPLCELGVTLYRHRAGIRTCLPICRWYLQMAKVPGAFTQTSLKSEHAAFPEA